MFWEPQCEVADEFAIKSLYVEVSFWDVLKARKATEKKSNHRMTKVRAWVCPRAGESASKPSFFPRNSQGFLCANVSDLGPMFQGSAASLGDKRRPGGPDRIGLRTLDEVGPTFGFTLQGWCWNCWMFQGFFPPKRTNIQKSHPSKIVQIPINR